MKNGRYENVEAVYWYLNNQLHREDGPAIERLSGTKEWYLNGQRHRENGPAVESANGTKEWWFNGQRHREDGPAVEALDKSKHWYQHGKRHREDGPAFEWFHAKKYFLNDQELTEEEFNQWLMKKKLNEKLHATFEPKSKEKKKKI
ncbi:hypothetical protein CLU92_5377 [Janthinobacterium sp. 61]|uniref:hypothetical protein n=1 Tax=Janthinobacterium sp. 61 TaxID=2035209 RepID=UPI000CBFF3EA|nr:hypothetical protein [Janthinobacterium sp. 61]PKV47903.1 hypothetical protein CLU92_5377 [Janthinobacterium sp. 61]